MTLDNIMENYSINTGTMQLQKTKMYSANDLEQLTATCLYMGPIGSNGSGFIKGSNGNIRNTNSIEGLQERYDCSGHDGTSDHLNYDLIGMKKSKESLGDNHSINLNSSS